MDFLNFQTISKGCDKGLKVLLVDEDQNSVMYMSRVLQEHSYRVTTSESAFEALRMILERRIGFDLIISDLDLPDMEGFEFLKQITSRSDIPVLLISASQEVEVIRKALGEGACFFFHKPIAQQNLVNIWQHVLRYRMERNQLKNGLIPSELAKYFEGLHGKGKSPLLSSTHFSNSADMGNFGMPGPSTVRIQNQSNSKNENYFWGESSTGVVQSGNGMRSEDDGKNSSDSSGPSSSGVKKQKKRKDKSLRMYWSLRLQQKFREAYEALGEARATPSRIKELMNEPKITPQHISSYLQKFRSRIKSQEEEATKYNLPTNVHNLLSMNQKCLSSNPPSLSSSPAPDQFNYNLNISRPNHGHIQTPGYVMPNASLSNFRTTSNIGSDNLRPTVEGNNFRGLHPQGSISTTPATNYWQTSVEAPNMVRLQNNVGVGNFIPGQVLQEMSYGLAGGNIGATEIVPGANGVYRVQEQNGGLGIEENNIDMNQELTEEDIKNLMQHISEDDSGNDGSSSGGNVSAYSVARPLTPRIETATGGERVHETYHCDFIEDDDMERFLSLLELPDNANDSFMSP